MQSNRMSGVVHTILPFLLKGAAAFIALTVLFLAVLWLMSPGTMTPLRDAGGAPLPGSLSEKWFTNVNGTRQGMFILSRDSTRPVLLYLHGGMPEFFLADRHPTGLEELFTVVWWEQRGSGISYGAAQAGSVTAEQLIDDAIETARLLRHRFGREKIYLLGHSGGTYIGLQAAARAPELFHAYIGVAQMSDQRRSETEAYDYMLRRFREEGDAEMVARLESAPVPAEGTVPAAYWGMRDEAMHRLGVGTMREMRSVVTGIFLPSLFCRSYTLAEKYGLWSSKAASGISPVWNEMLTTDLAAVVRDVPVPVYFFHGAYDRTCSYDGARRYFETLTAPVKGFYTFHRSAHSPMFEEPERMRDILLRDVLSGGTALADPR